MAGSNVRALFIEFNTYEKVKDQNWNIFVQRLADSIAMDFQEAKAEWVMSKSKEFEDLDFTAKEFRPDRFESLTDTKQTFTQWKDDFLTFMAHCRAKRLHVLLQAAELQDEEIDWGKFKTDVRAIDSQYDLGADPLRACYSTA